VSRAVDLAEITPGFSDPVFESQTVFRALLGAMAGPGVITDVPVALDAPAPSFQAQAALALTMLDFETPVYLDPALGRTLLQNWLRFHCGCPIAAAPSDAAFAFVGAATMPSLVAFNAGDPKYPDRSTTVVVGCEALVGGAEYRLAGPGIATQISIAPVGICDAFWDQLHANHEAFPLGVDVVLASGNSIIGLPRTVRLADRDGQGEH
jgi:alpha-D-ribose 1-methylphosphonate 5-triphosphate synthase subunit PhnH